ncbi:MAG: alpha/beta fold hydrolase [Kofleriaceae bacterium]
MVSRLVLLVCVALALPATAGGKPRWETLPLPPAMPTPIATGEELVGDASIYYAVFGAGDPVILLHGGMGNGDHFSHQVSALIDRFSVIAIDSRGQGRSTLGTAKLSYGLMARDVLAVMNKLGIARAAIVGWSDGGEIGLHLAIHHPDRVARLFVFGANYDAAGSKPRRRRPPTFVAYGAKCKSDYVRLSKTPKGFSKMVTALRPVWRTPGGFTKDQLRAIAAPTMVADGDHDEIIVLDQVKEMAALIPGGQLAIFEGTSHFALWQDPAAFNRVLRAFLTGQPGPSAPDR